MSRGSGAPRGDGEGRVSEGDACSHPIRELYTTRELVNEFLRRKTFQGIIVHSEQECRGTNWGDEKIFQVHFNDDLSREQACRLLDVVVSWMDREYC